MSVKVVQFQLFLFVSALEALLILIKSKPEIEGITVFDCNCHSSAYADDTIFFLKDIISIKHMVETWFFLYFSGLKLNLRKSEIAGIGVPKRVQVAVWYALYRLNNDTLKILGSHFSYKKKLKEEKKFFQVHNRYSTSIENMENKKPYTRRENF